MIRRGIFSTMSCPFKVDIESLCRFMRNPDPLIEPEPVNISDAAMNPEPWKNPDPFKNPEPLKGDDDIGYILLSKLVVSPLTFRLLSIFGLFIADNNTRTAATMKQTPETRYIIV